MKINVLGGGPAGLYVALLLKQADPTRALTVVERNPPDATYGFGVVFSDRTLAAFREADHRTYHEITSQFVLWDAIDVRFRGELLRCGGHVFAGLRRQALLGILQRRCAELGVALRFRTEVAALDELDDCDLLIAADGVNSLARRTHEAIFRPRVSIGRARYVWFGTDRVLDAFTFLFRENEHGFFQVHAYPFSGSASTFIVECDEATWQRAGLDAATEDVSLAYCERLFADDLRGARLLSNNSKWVSFPLVKTATWRHGNLVLLGDAAHTAHFSIGSGTKLAMEDAISLAHAVDLHPDLATALGEYELERRPVVEALQAAARESQAYFERVANYRRMAPEQFTTHLLTRSGRISYDDLRQRDARYVARVERWFAAQAVGADAATPTLVTPPPAFTPLALGTLALPNRVAVALDPAEGAADGVIGDAWGAAAERGAATGAALLLSPSVAVEAAGRVTPDDPGLWRAAQQAAWARAIARAHERGARVALQLGHAGPRGATEPRARGLDRPLRAGGWPLLAASARPYTPASQVPRAMDRALMDRVREAWASAARRAASAAADLLLLDFAHGYLLASFLSPLTNQREDEYGGCLEHRLRYPLEVLDAVRAAWPAGRPLAVALSVADCAPGGVAVEEGIAIAAALHPHGCDLIAVRAGQTVPAATPPYGRGYLTTLSDRVRNEAGVATLVGGYLTTLGEAHTILAAGRADLCLLEAAAM
ncbi:MAG TPA: FAD-dependent monooxygenase [Ktedonobacterales bacterium]